MICFSYFLSPIHSFINDYFNVLMMISKIVFNIIIFTIQTRPVHNVPEYQLTIATYMNLIQYRLLHNASYYRMKLRMFHAIMLAKFILYTAKADILKLFTGVVNWLTMIAFSAMSPLLPFMNGILY